MEISPKRLLTLSPTIHNAMIEGSITVGVLALQGAFNEHVQLLRQAAQILSERSIDRNTTEWNFIEVRTSEELKKCDALVIPGGESTTIALIAKRSALLEDLRSFVKYEVLLLTLALYAEQAPSPFYETMCLAFLGYVFCRAIGDHCIDYGLSHRVQRRPTWGTCAGLILLSESANITSTKRGGQDLIGGLDVRINRNHFGRQVESFEADLDLPFLQTVDGEKSNTDKLPFRSVFIRAPVVETILSSTPDPERLEDGLEEENNTIRAPSREPEGQAAKQVTQLGKAQGVEVMARLPGRAKRLPDKEVSARLTGDEGDIVAVRQGNVFGIAFHPELTGDARIHVWWLKQVRRAVEGHRRSCSAEP